MNICERVQGLEQKHTDWRAKCINLIASENVASPSVRGRLSSDLSNRYVNAVAPTLSSRWKEYEPTKFYEGTEIYDDIERMCTNLLRKLFKTKYADFRPISSNISILANWTALSQRGDTLMTTSEVDGGHNGWFELGKLLDRKMETWPFDGHEYTVDIDRAVKKVKEVKPKLMVFGSSQILFPAPLKELRAVAEEVGAHCVFDGSHVMGLIAGGAFQDPIREGAISLFGSTHKTFFGPQGGLVLSDANDEIIQKLDHAIDPGILCNYHANHVAALTVAAAELIKFGSKYAEQVVKNAKALAQALSEEGFGVLCEHKRFTDSHQVLFDVSKQGFDGADAARTLTSANIICTKAWLPGDNLSKCSGLRVGTSEVTRLGMKVSEMKRIAELIRLCIIDRKGSMRIRRQATSLAQEYPKIHYSFDEGTDAYETS